MGAAPVSNLRNPVLHIILKVQFFIRFATAKRANQVTGRVTRQIQPIALAVFYGEQSRLLGTLKVSAIGKVIGSTARFDKLPPRPVPRDFRARKFAPPRIGFRVSGIPVTKSPVGAFVMDAATVGQNHVHPGEWPTITHGENVQVVISADPESSRP